MCIYMCIPFKRDCKYKLHIFMDISTFSWIFPPPLLRIRLGKKKKQPHFWPQRDLEGL